ncbi:MAG: hypothetical protein BroJett029_42690 [Alphaproteobacteria bacterium]|nr:MAG: hypothetical protein BroJett029_42690 [Alphaproteobacteria bacterium]
MPISRSGSRLRSVLLIVLLFPLTLPAVTPAEAWRALADSRPQDVLRMLRSLPAGRETQLIRALALMHRQPVTDEALRQAEILLVSLAAGEDDFALQAHFLQARLHQVHYAQPDPARAAELYAALAARQPGSRWAQLARVKLALLQLYVLPTPAGPEARLQAAEAELARLAEPALQRDLHLQIGLAGLHHGLPPARVLPHLLAADRIGGVPGVAQEDLVLQIGELSLRVGDFATARAYFERYLRDYAVNPRCFTVRHRLRELEARAAAEGSS